MEVLRVKTGRRTQLVDVTDAVKRAMAAAGVVSGVCYVYVPHTTAGVVINEHFDPDVASDLEGVFEKLVPRSGAVPARGGEFGFACKGGDDGNVANDICGGGEARIGAMAGGIFLRI